MTTILVSGYRAFELGIFGEKDPRITIIKQAIRRDLIRFCEEGLRWLIFTGNIGFETWVLEVATELVNDYQFSMATLFCFADHGSQWNDNNQAKLAAFKALDFVKYSFDSYQNPSQLKAHQQFLIENTDQAYLFYDPEHQTSLRFLYNLMKEQDYPIHQLQFDDLNDIVIENE